MMTTMGMLMTTTTMMICIIIDDLNCNHLYIVVSISNKTMSVFAAQGRMSCWTTQTMCGFCTYGFGHLGFAHLVCTSEFCTSGFAHLGSGHIGLDIWVLDIWVLDTMADKNEWHPQGMKQL